MDCIKGVVIEKLKGLIKIQLETGEHFWIAPTPQLKPKARVLVGWDWTHNQPTFVTTSFEDVDVDEPDEDDIPVSAERYDVVDEALSDVFSMTERSEGHDVNDVNDV